VILLTSRPVISGLGIALVAALIYSCLLNIDSLRAAQENPDGSTREHYPVREDWEPSDTGLENVSIFVYRDRGRTGKQNVDDPSLAGIVVKLTDPDGGTVTRTSNMYGFANFTTGLNRDFADISQEGQFRFEVVPPPEWEVTGASGIQELEFEKRPRSRVGLVAANGPSEVGLRQVLSIQGTLDSNGRKSEELPAGFIVATSASGSMKPEFTQSDGSYSVSVYPGLWHLQFFREKPFWKDSRIVHVEDVPVRLLDGHGLRNADQTSMNAVERARYRLIDFERFARGKARKMPSGWCGLHWENLVVTEFDAYSGAGYANSLVQGSHVGYNSSGYPVTIESNKGFDFHGAYFGGAWPNAEGETLKFTAWREEEELKIGEFALSAYGPFQLQANLVDITKLKVATRHNWQFVMDSPAFSFSAESSIQACHY